MTTRFVLAGLAALVITGPANAQQFYIVQDTATKKCRVVSEKPTSTTTVVVGGDKVYSSQGAAEHALPTIPACAPGPGGPATR